MHTAQFPFFVIASHEVRALLGPNLGKASVLALRAILLNRKSLEIAHQQIRFGKHHLAISSRIGREGDLILNLDVGDPNLSDRLILENDLRRAEQTARANARSR